ncbi:MAG: hypothetical protein ACJ76H_07515 [Bacteriovoracaceae bacterium]
MKFLALILITFSAQAMALPHLDLEMTSQEYDALLKNVPKSMNADPEVEAALKLGQRLSAWIAKVNTGRSETTAIRLTSPQTRRGIPIDKPSIYNPAIIKQTQEEVLGNMPKEMRDVILSTGELPGTIPVSDELFITHGRLLDRNYQSAARYKSLYPYISQYTSLASNDVRGYYYLTSNKITANELRDTSLIAADKVKPIKDALTGICNNAGGWGNCAQTVEKAWSANKLADHYTKYYPSGKKLWDAFFDIPDYGRRSDIVWSGNTMTVPFNTPTIAKFIHYLQDNIEDEYRWNGWGLKMKFGSFANGPHLEFQSGVVPHVNGLGGNTIVMDDNQPIEEYESQWTIRHEFGHVLGLPDCYHEFYDVNLKAFVNYQLDITDLMCSRAGNMKERIYTELKQAYAK